jgi:hypothetical protein
MAKGRIISTLDPYDKFALKNYQDALRTWDEANRPQYLPSPTYLDDILNRMPDDLKEG